VVGKVKVILRSNFSKVSTFTAMRFLHL